MSKIWLVITDNDGGVDAAAYFTESAARAAFADLVQMSWVDEFPHEPMPDDAQEAYEILRDQPGFTDFLSLRECDVAPAQDRAQDQAQDQAAPVLAPGAQLADLPAPAIEPLRSFNLQLAVSVRAYGSVEVEAASLADALEKVRADAANGVLHGVSVWDHVTDVEWSSECEHSIISAEDGDTGETFQGLDLTPPTDPNKIISADELRHALTHA